MAREKPRRDVVAAAGPITHDQVDLPVAIKLLGRLAEAGGTDAEQQRNRRDRTCCESPKDVAAHR
jgi:hypothetical protein